MRNDLKYFKFLLLHKWYVFLECCELGIPWRGIKHDMGKFRPKAFRAYAKRFAAGNGYENYDDTGYLYVFVDHLRRSQHHWQYWLYVRNNGEIRYLEMPDNAQKELLADLRGSSRHYGTDVTNWFFVHIDEFHLHSETMLWLKAQMMFHEEVY